MLAAILFYFGVILLVSTGLTLWYCYYRTILFHLALLLVLPVYCTVWLGRWIVPSAEYIRGADGRVSPVALGVAAACIVLIAAGTGALQRLLFAQNLAVQSRYGFRSGHPLERIAHPTASLVASLGIYTAGVAALGWSATSESITLDASGSLWPALQFGNLNLPLFEFAVALISVLVYLVVSIGLRRTAVGRGLRALNANPALAAAFGVNATAAEWSVLLAGSICVAIAGFLIGVDSAIAPSTGFRWLLSGAGAMILFGATLGRSFYPFLLVGSGAVAVLFSLLARFLPAAWSETAGMLVVLGVLLAFPKGLVGAYQPPRR